MKTWIRRIVLFAGIGFLIALGVLVVLFTAVSPKVATKPVRVVRDAGGHWRTVEGKPWPRPVPFSAQWSTGKTQTHLNTDSWYCHSLRNRFACARIAILPESDHLLLKRVAESMVTELMQRPFVKEIRYYPSGRFVGVGQESPDLYIALKLTKVHETGSPWSRQLKATVHVEAGSTASNGECGLSKDQYDPPVLYFNWTGDIDFQGRQKGITSSALRYKAEGGVIAKALARSLGDDCVKQLKTFGVRPTLPANFSPAYQPPPSLPFLKRYHATRILSTHGLLTATNTYWRISAPHKERDEVFNDIWRELTAAGWRGNRPTFDQERMELISKTNTARRLVVANEAMQTHAVRIGVFYQTRLTDEELANAIDGWLTDPAHVDDALLFLVRMSPAQKKQISLLMQSHPQSSVEAYITLAELLHEQRRLPAARRALQQTFLMQRTAHYDTEQQQRIDELAKVLQVEPQVTVPLLRQRGR